MVVLGGLALLMSAAGLATPVGHDAPSPAVAASPTPSLATVESLYSQDLIARINAERAARNSPFVSLPQLTVDPQLEADAQAWSASIASTGQVADPSLPACDGPSPGVVCLLAANAGNTGYGYWPGDGSDGMDGAYMASADHRQNELNAAYTAVGVGVTCADNQAWTVELFGEAYGDVPQANAREAAQDDTQGDPVPQSPVGGRRTLRRSRLLPRPDCRPQRRGDCYRRSVRVPLRRAGRARRAQRRAGLTGGRDGRHQ